MAGHEDFGKGKQAIAFVAMMTDDNPVTIKLSAKIIAEIVLGKIRFPGYNSDDSVQNVRAFFITLQKAVGKDELAKLIANYPAAGHAFVDMIFDAITGIVGREETLKRLKSLPMTQRVMVEKQAALMTGKSSRGDGPRNHMDDGLWSLKSMIDGICATSVSEITERDIREGYDALVHAVIDAVYERWQTLVT